MSDKFSIGPEGEEHAASHLVSAGYRILHRNWTSGKRELDIVAENDREIVFVEVKTRSGDDLVSPASAVNREKQKSIILAAETYIKRYDIVKESRFDIITVIKNRKGITVDHIINAFYPTLR